MLLIPVPPTGFEPRSGNGPFVGVPHDQLELFAIALDAIAPEISSHQLAGILELLGHPSQFGGLKAKSCPQCSDHRSVGRSNRSIDDLEIGGQFDAGRQHQVVEDFGTLFVVAGS
jgi:hypothetical protein